MIKQWTARWRKMSPGDRLRAQFVLALMLIGVYGLVLYPLSKGALDESERMLNRRKDRIEKRANIAGLKDTGLNPEVMRRKIEEVEARIQAVAAGFDELDTGFAPVDSSEVRQQLMLEISTLAARTGVELLSVSRKGMAGKGEMIAVPVDPVLGRPLLVINASAPFWNLYDFLRGMKDLSFYASVMNLKIYTQPKADGARHGSPLPAGALHVALEVSI